MKLGIDVDGCLAQFTGGYAERIREVTGRDLLTQEMIDNPPCWDWDIAAGYTQDEIKQTWASIKSDKHFWFDLEPVPLAKDAVYVLHELAWNGHEVYFITDRPGVATKRQTEGWLVANGMDVPTVIVTGDKIPIINTLKLDFFIDDRPITITKVLNETSLDPYMVQYAYNAPHCGNPRVKCVDSVYDALFQEKLIDTTGV